MKESYGEGLASHTGPEINGLEKKGQWIKCKSCSKLIKIEGAVKMAKRSRRNHGTAFKAKVAPRGYKGATETF